MPGTFAQNQAHWQQLVKCDSFEILTFKEGSDTVEFRLNDSFQFVDAQIIEQHRVTRRHS